VASRRKYRDQFARWHATYEKRAAKELRKTFRDWINNIKFDDLNGNNTASILTRSTDTNQMLSTYINIYTEIGKVHGKRVGKNINLGLKDFTYDIFERYFFQNVTIYITKFGLGRIKTVQETFIADISRLLANRIDLGQTIVEAAREIKNIVNKPSFYKWQALRIARTETTAAANFAAVEAGKVSGFVMEKEWISALDDRTRGDHAGANGQRVLEGDKFNVGGEMLSYPGDPAGSAGTVVNCRCTIAIVAKRDKNGDLIPTS